MSGLYRPELFNYQQWPQALVLGPVGVDKRGNEMQDVWTSPVFVISAHSAEALARQRDCCRLLTLATSCR